MHEMSLAEGVLQVIEDSAKINGFSRVKTVWLEIGELAGVEVEAMCFCFDAMVKGTLADGARLEVVATEGQGHCLTCGEIVHIRLRYDPCPLCGGHPVEPFGGLEMKVKELEVE
ncbi:MAG: hydrogenase maturation nickel metallochaperone HypA [Betaproteobacteria bacterium CG2_30_59_46]|nr:MAG: hydrogenase maturation nickel metallochaperone HypA [Betaproteobacteria bacterium CG2_30_59_46]PIQ11789.1 MAG: hydrogenase maturation nickel metallochaperone HypA [Hydrogenophilales bacterium CG18_big_fil_WC_8_21_14_2_50_58_12]PJB07623.1 MAG: hydrogenase maturation nickel metallochaperone HypA [Hydrogenophilales bacterium CG_4_9_14_3_um_filter_59_35]